MKRLDKELRYALIKGKAEKKNELLKPWIFRSLEVRGLTERYIEMTLSGKYRELGIEDELNKYI